MNVRERQAFGQLLHCHDCCCGHTDRDSPEVPVDRFKSAWKAGRWDRTIQRTVSGCVGPCDVANVAELLTPRGTTWLGTLAGDRHFDALFCWTEACRDAGRAPPLPAQLDAHRFESFVTGPDPSPPPACTSAPEGEATA